jgi:hypothetical protein
MSGSLLTYKVKAIRFTENTKANKNRQLSLAVFFVTVARA